MAEKVDRIDWHVRFKEMCPWLEMAETDRSRSRNLRGEIFKRLNVSDSTVVCWLTGVHCAVKVAHIIPDSTKNSVLKMLGLPPEFRNDTNDPRNFMILGTLIEEAFDAMQISFYPIDLLRPTQLYLKIWDEDVRDKQVGLPTDPDPTARTRTFGELESAGAMLSVPAPPEGWAVSLRALSYHNLCCYIYQTYKGNKSLGDMPADFTSQSGHDKDEVRKKLVGLFRSALRMEMAEEEEEWIGSDHESIDVGDTVTRVAKPKRKGNCTIM